jgi:hypothetical protein
MRVSEANDRLRVQAIAGHTKATDGHRKVEEDESREHSNSQNGNVF